MCVRPNVVAGGSQCLNGEPVLPPPNHRLYQCFDIRSFEADVYVTVGNLGFDCKVSALGADGKTPTQSNLVVSVDCVSGPPSPDTIIKVAIDWVATKCYPGVSTVSSFNAVSTAGKKRQASSGVYSLTVDQAPNSGLSGGAIAGIVIGCIAAAILVVVLVGAIFYTTSSKDRLEKV